MGTYIVQKAIEPDDLSTKQREAMNARLYRYRVQPKIDGCHAVFLYREGGHPAVVLSSTGEAVHSCGHLVEQLRPKNIPPGVRLAVLAEVYLPGALFKDSSGAFRRQSPQPELCAAVFDVVQWVWGPLDPDPQLFSDLSYEVRLRQAQQVYGLTLLPLLQAHGEDVGILAQEWQLGGFNGALCDGAVYRDLDARYEAKRCRKAEVVKIKPLLSFDLEVIGVDLAKGEKTGKNTAALVTRFKDDVHLRVATGLTQEEVDELHRTHGDSHIGKIVRVDALGHTGTGSLREPRFKGVRDDKTNPDF